MTLPKQQRQSSQSTFSGLQHFLLTGCDSGVYRAAAYEPCIDRATDALRAIADNGPESVEQLLAFENARPEAALFVLALAASPRFAAPETVSRALAALPLVAAKAQDLATFAAYVESMRGWGRGLRSAIANWYSSQPVPVLAAQILRSPLPNLRKHRALLRRAHPKANDLAQNALFQWIVEGSIGHLATPAVLGAELRLVEGFARIRESVSEQQAIHCIEDYRLQPAQVPSRWKKSAAVWEALYDHLSYRQLLRFLPVMTSVGLLRRESEYAALAVARLADRKRLQTAAVHPLRIVQAMKQYRAVVPRPVESVFDALDEAFHLSLGNVPAVGKRIVAAVDSTGSMQGAPVAGMPHVPAALAGAALVLSLARAEDRNCVPMAFHRQTRPLQRFGKADRLADALNEVRATPSRSDTASVIRYAIENRLETDAFVIVTDRLTRETASLTGLTGELLRYRDRMGIDAKLVLVTLAGGEVAGWNQARLPDVIALSGLDTHQAAITIRAFLH